MTDQEQEIERDDKTKRSPLEALSEESAESEWRREAARARSIALKRGIDQQTIDAAIEELR